VTSGPPSLHARVPWGRTTVVAVRSRATFEIGIPVGGFRWELALALFYAALAAFLALVGAKVLFVLALALTVVFGYQAARCRVPFGGSRRSAPDER
jgi:hypothetical protein